MAFLAGLYIPQSHLTCHLEPGLALLKADAAAGQECAVWAEAEHRVLGGLGGEGEHFLAGLRVPHPHLTLYLRSARSGGQTFAVSAEGHAADRDAPTLEGQ